MRQPIPSGSAFFWIIFSLCLLILLPFLAIAFYNHPSADDYICVIPAMQWGPITTTLGWYFSWSSRFTSAFFISLNPLVYNWLTGYQLNAWLLMAMVSSGFFFWFRAVSRFSSFPALASLAILAFTAYLATVPSMVEAFYYLSGAICYQPANSFLLFLVGWWFFNIPLPTFSHLNFRSVLVLGIQSFLLFLIAGTNEMAMMFGLSLSGGLWLYRLITDKKWHPGLALLFLASIFSTGLVIFSPATYYRMQASSSLKRSLGDVLTNSAAGYLEYVGVWLSNPAFLLCSVLLLFIQVSDRVPLLKRPWLIALTSLSVLLSAFCFVPSFLGEGMVQGRTANALLFNFFLLYMLNVVFWKRNLFTSTVSGLTEPTLSLPVRILMLATVLSVLLTSNFRNVFNDLNSGDAAAYNQERLERIRQVETSVSDSIWVQPVQHRPKTIFFGEIGDYPQPWYDNFYAVYHGKKFIHLVESGKVK